MTGPWLGSDIARLKRLYPTLPRAELIREFAPRTWVAIRTMAAKLGIDRPAHLGGHRDWTKIAAEHCPMFVLPSDVPIPYKRPWS